MALEEERGRATDRKAAFSKSGTLLSLIELVMSNLTGVELMCSVRENQAHEVVLRDNDQSSRALETASYKRSARRVCVRRWSTPAARGSAC